MGVLLTGGRGYTSGNQRTSSCRWMDPGAQNGENWEDLDQKSMERTIGMYESVESGDFELINRRTAGPPSTDSVDRDERLRSLD